MGSKLLRVAICLVGILAMLNIGLASAETPATLVVHYVDAFSSPDEVHAYLSVFDAQGNPVEKLDKASFSAREDGAPLTISEVVPATSPMAMAVAIDLSGSMLDGRPSGIQAAKDAAKNLIGQTDAADQVAIVSFSDKVEVNLGLTSDHGAATNTVGQLNAERKNTALYDACYEATSLVAKVQRGRRVVILLTDGEDTSSLLKVEDCLNVSQQGAVPVYTVGLGRAIDANALGRIAKLSGGRFYRSPSPQELEGVFADISRALKTQYVLKYPSAASDGDHTLSVALQAAGQPLQEERRFRMPAWDPRPSFASPTSGQEVQGKVSVRLFTKKQRPLVKVEYYVDRTLEFTAEAEPFGWEMDSTRLSEGPHFLSAKVFDAGGRSGVVEMTVPVKAVPRPTATVALPTPTPTPLPQGLEALMVVVKPNQTLYGVGAGALLVVIVSAVVLSRRRQQLLFDDGGVMVEGPITTPSDKTQEVSAGGRTQGFDPLSDVMLGRLSIVSGGQADKVFEVYDGYIVGRETGEIRLEDRTVSGSHAQFHLVQGEVQVSDLNSLNGVLINNRTKLQGNSMVLQSGERLRIGRTTMVFTKDIVRPQEPLGAVTPVEAGNDGRSDETQWLEVDKAQKPIRDSDGNLNTVLSSMDTSTAEVDDARTRRHPTS